MISLTSPVDTWAHRWPAGAKLAGLCAATLVLFSLDAPLPHLGFLIITLTLYALPGRLFLRNGLSRLWGLWPFVVLVLGWHFLTDDVVQGVVIAERMVTAVALANLVTMTTRLSAMMGVVRWLLAPLRRVGVRTEVVELSMALVIRFTPVLATKGRALVLAWRARSPRRPGWRIVLPFTVMAIDDAERVAEALRARGGL